MSKAEEFVSSFMGHRASTLQLAEKIQDASFRPWEKALTAGELFGHMASAGLLFSNSVAQGAVVRPNPPAEKPDLSDMIVVRELLKQQTNETIALLQGLPDSAFDTLIDASAMFGREVPGGFLLAILRDHEIHHKGQLFVYARMTGVQEMPPIAVR
jgi:uncharacterized damage-inducible protein DinB